MPKRAVLPSRTASALALLSLFLSKSLFSSPVPDPLDAARSRVATSDGGAAAMRAAGSARSEDVSSPEAIVGAVYDVISGPAGKKRDWNRFRSLFAEGARLIPTGPRPTGDFGPKVFDAEGYVQRTEPIFATTSFYEKEVARRVDRFGHIAHVFSTYEARHDPADAKPFLRGINSFQLVFDGTRWWVLTIFWEAESESVKIPAQYLP